MSTILSEDRFTVFRIMLWFAGAGSEGKSLRHYCLDINIRLPSSAAGGSKSRDRHFAAVWVSMLTTWTRRLTPSLGSAAFFSLVLP